MESYLKKGIISWDHLHKSTGDAGFIIGEPLDVKFGKGSTFVKAKLYKTVEKAQRVVDLLKGGCTRLGASIGGFIRETVKLGKSVKGISRIIWDEVAVTYKPVNDFTRGNVSLIPIGAFAKALAAGAGAGFDSVGGRAMIPESLQGSTIKVDKLMKEFVWRLGKGDIKSKEDFQDFLEYHEVPFLYGHLSKVLVNKFN